VEKKVKKKLGFLQKCQQKQMVSRNWKKTRNLVGVKRSIKCEEVYFRFLEKIRERKFYRKK